MAGKIWQLAILIGWRKIVCWLHRFPANPGDKMLNFRVSIWFYNKLEHFFNISPLLYIFHIICHKWSKIGIFTYINDVDYVSNQLHKYSILPKISDTYVHNFHFYCKPAHKIETQSTDWSILAGKSWKNIWNTILQYDQHHLSTKLRVKNCCLTGKPFPRGLLNNFEWKFFPFFCFFCQWR